LAQIADALNQRGVRSASGGVWHRSAVRNLLARAQTCETQTAEDALIAKLATDPAKRQTFAKLAKELKQLAEDLGAEIARREGKDAA
jgi:hypothetical protein